MTKAFQNQLQSILKGLDIELDPDIELEVKPFFGGAAAYANGQICLSLSKAGFALKLPESDRLELIDRGARPLRYFPRAPIKREYVTLTAVILNDHEELSKWVRKCIKYVIER